MEIFLQNRYQQLSETLDEACMELSIVWESIGTITFYWGSHVGAGMSTIIASLPTVTESINFLISKLKI